MMFRLASKVLVAGLLASVTSGQSLAVHHIVQLGAAFDTETRDTMIFQNNVDNGAGGAPGFFAGSNSQPSPRRGLLSFDLSTIPQHATITDVSLRLVIGQLAGSGGGVNPPGTFDPVIGLHRLLVSWGEEDTGRSTASVLNGTGQGTLAEEGDSTWNARFYHETTPVTWNAPGGASGIEFVGLPSASFQQPNERYAESIWASTSALVADVQGWLDAPTTNHGWMLINTDEVARQTFRGFFSHDYNPISLPTDLPMGSPLNEAADFWPVLTVSYELPSGDFDGDGDVDGRDFLLWQRDPGIGNLLDWQQNYGSSSLQALAVPEPSCVVIAIIVAMMLPAYRGIRHPEVL